MDELIIDNFAGGGGASAGIAAAFGRAIDVAINHDGAALAMHEANHPSTRHLCSDVFEVDPFEVTGGKPVGLAWFSPDCTHFSKAKGGKPRKKNIRSLAWVVIKWAGTVKPRVIMLENVEEFQDWGPLDADDKPCPRRRGLTFRRWRRELERCGYKVELRVLRACDYGAPTTRKRLFVIARCDGRPIVWPAPSHGKALGLKPYRTAAECIDWSLPCPSIFERERPLADATLRRIARGTFRFVLDAATPFIIPVTHPRDARVHSIDEPFRTITGAPRGEFALIAPTLIQTGYGEREGQAPRSLDLGQPLGTVMGGGCKHALVAAFLAKHYGDTGQRPGSKMDEPVDTITACDHHSLVALHIQRDFGASIGHALDEPSASITAGGGGHSALVASHLVKLKGTCRDGQRIDEPIHTIQAGGCHYAEVRAFLTKFRTGSTGQSLDEPMPTVTANSYIKRPGGAVPIGLVVIAGTQYHICDIGMRMLEPRELFNAQGFPSDYCIKPVFRGRYLTKTQQVRLCGNSVPPPFAEALCRANFPDEAAVEVAA